MCSEGLVRWKNLASVGPFVKKLENDTIKLRNTTVQVKSIGTVSAHHSCTSLKEGEQSKCEEHCAPSRADKECSCDLLRPPSSSSGNKMSREEHFTEGNQRSRKQSFRFVGLGAMPNNKGMDASPTGEKKKFVFASAVHKCRRWVSGGVFNFLQTPLKAGQGTYSSLHSVDDLLIVPMCDGGPTSSVNT